MTYNMKTKEVTRMQLLALPVRGWNDTSRLYDSLLIFPSDETHESGWRQMIIVGCVDNQPIEILTQRSDDIEWDIKPSNFGLLRTDCTPESGILHFWHNNRKFHVGTALSSITITLN